MKQKLTLFLCVILGNAMLAFSVCAFVVPNHFMLGGASGIALALQHFFPLRLSVLSAIVNGTLFFLGWICLGRKFALTTLLSTIVYPLIMAVFETLPIGTLFQEDKLVCAIFCGILSGFGIGIVVRAGGSTGGMDIPPIVLNKYKGVPVGTSLMIFDSSIVLLQVCLQGLDGILCSILIIIIMSMAINWTTVGGEQKVQITIISPEYEQIRQAVLKDLDSGVTMLNIETGYDEKPQKAVFCVVYAKKYPEIRSAALAIDPKAFIVTTDVKNVNGRGYTLDRSYR